MHMVPAAMIACTLWKTTDPSEANGDGGEPYQPALSAVGTGGEGEVVLEVNDDILDLAELVLGHQILHRPARRKEEHAMSYSGERLPQVLDMQKTIPRGYTAGARN